MNHGLGSMVDSTPHEVVFRTEARCSTMLAESSMRTPIRMVLDEKVVIRILVYNIALEEVSGSMLIR